MPRRVKSSILVILVVAALMALSTAIASADPRDFTLINRTGTTIYYVYVSPTDSGDWGDDVLGSDVVLTGRSVDIVFSRFQPGRCYYDIKVIDANDVDGYLWSVDLCGTNSVTFH